MKHREAFLSYVTKQSEDLAEALAEYKAGRNEQLDKWLERYGYMTLKLHITRLMEEVRDATTEG